MFYDKLSLSVDEVEKVLNEFAVMFFGNDSRKIIFHEFRGFPFIEHGKSNIYDSTGSQNNYTVQDLLFIRIVRKHLRFNKKTGNYRFISKEKMSKYVANKIYPNDISVSKIAIDELFNIMCNDNYISC